MQIVTPWIPLHCISLLIAKFCACERNIPEASTSQKINPVKIKVFAVFHAKCQCCQEEKRAASSNRFLVSTAHASQAQQKRGGAQRACEGGGATTAFLTYQIL